ncbi:hypothetical protein TNCV_180081 [Trichonephila clavipes]|nr:hypothetical protein TNCV_180081 [Trichonephila clavipes]
MVGAVHPGSLQLQVVKQGHPYLTPPHNYNHGSCKTEKIVRILTHCDIAGNEHADLLAKKGAFVIQTPARISTFNSLRFFSDMGFEYNFKMRVEEMSKDKDWAIVIKNPSWFPGASRKAANTYDICWNIGFVNSMYLARIMLKSVLKDQWEKISAEETTRFVSSMLKRLQEVIQPAIK